MKGLERKGEMTIDYMCFLLGPTCLHFGDLVSYFIMNWFGILDTLQEGLGVDRNSTGLYMSCNLLTHLELLRLF